MECLSIKELVIATEGTLVKGNESDKIQSIAIDSRKAKSTDAFIAIIGESLDGHNFMQSAYENGCKTFIKNRSNGIKFESSDINLIEVEDTTKALGDIANFYKCKFEIPYIGVTGSVGKTTTKDMIYAAISTKFNTLKNEGNFNNHIGVPLTLFNLKPSHDCAIIEMGMSNFKEIEYLAKMVNPKVGVISNIGLSHIENLGSQEGILKAKLEIASNFDESNTLIVNGDDKYLKKICKNELNYDLKTFGFDNNNDIYCTEYNIGEDELSFECMINNKKEYIYIPTVGKHNIYNAMAAILVGLRLGMDLKDIKDGLKNFKASKMRLDIIKKEYLTIINDAYNASPDSMKAALDILGRYKKRKVAILGDMFEMGEHSEYGHRLVGEYAINNVDVLITIGESSKYISDECIKLGLNSSNVYHFDNKEIAIEKLSDIINKDDVVLVKASRGMQLENIVQYLNR
ncbi:UDP-N-acetylmuramoyl-tripeptide--D-alanyl-D-alanine ligase [Paraclostridium ghonii]|uniref:UDP-N-acetylmuramoyl-tripeptide--D-alanyl-D- alanine ligase n=1 Tax=Paraclostridium ghonii TaxID=29358 RepID=UPI00202CFF3E|nr:UDP-N-acetylmuramoyl-tripeptide--D-alanyl-D-alanine ligase [Paeniclostridium ghonii]MCM0164852.1 UDP-N-acetylmuramoyl-tripeptide--D-alanyl-D-alanine ligase [Paeniclostridium ghonii]